MKKTDVESKLNKLKSECEKAKKKYKLTLEDYNKLKKDRTYTCLDDVCYEKFDFKNKQVKETNKHFKSCGKSFAKDRFLHIITEDYVVNQIYSDCGYGDGDMFQWQHEFRMWRVCPNCGSLEYIEYAITNTKGEWSRIGWNSEAVAKMESEFKPEWWKGKKVIFCGNEKECKKLFKQIKYSACGKWWK